MPMTAFSCLLSTTQFSKQNKSISSNDSGNTMSLASTAGNKKRSSEHGVGIDSQTSRCVRGKAKPVAETNPDDERQVTEPEDTEVSNLPEPAQIINSGPANKGAFNDLFVRLFGDKEKSKTAFMLLDDFELGLHEEKSIVRFELCSTGICQNILKAIRDHPLDEEVQKLACQLVFDLSRHNYNTNFKEIFINVGAVETIRSATIQETSGKGLRENEELLFLANLALSSLGKDTFIVR
jgi:hypothetical protein